MAVFWRRPSTSMSFGTVTKLNVKATDGQVLSVYVSNANVAARFFQLHNKATAPVAAEVPVLSLLIPAGSAAAPAVLAVGQDILADEEDFRLGIGWALSTTAGTFTDAATAADHIIIVRYR